MNNNIGEKSWSKSDSCSAERASRKKASRLINDEGSKVRQLAETFTERY